MKACFKYNEGMYRYTYPIYQIEVTDKFKKKHLISLSDFTRGYVKCPKCNTILTLKNTDSIFLDYHNILEYKDYIRLEHLDWLGSFCYEPLHKYSCKLIQIDKQFYIGSFRTTPIVYHNYKKHTKHTFRPYTDRLYTYKGYRLKNDTCYVEPIYNYNNKLVIDNYEDTLLNNYKELSIKVKFRKCKPKDYDSGRRSTGWKSKKQRKQWMHNKG